MGKVVMQPVGVIKARLGIAPNGPNGPNGRVQRKFQSLCAKYMADYIPGGKGGSIEKLKDLSDPTKIVYYHPAAHYLYIGNLYVMDNGKGAYYSPTYGYWSKPGVRKIATTTPLKYHAGGGKQWAERMKSAEMDSLIEDLQNYIDRGGK